MVIEKEQLISLLKKKTTLNQEQVKAQLSELADHIQDAIKQGETLRVEELGTFGIMNGKLQFVPNNTLKMEINTKYAGMKPIELIGAFKEPDTDQISVTDYTDDIEAGEHIDPLTFEEQTPEAEPVAETPELSEEGRIPEDEQEEEAEQKLPSKPEAAPVNSDAKPGNNSKTKTLPAQTRNKKKTAAATQIGSVERVVTAVVYVLIFCIIGWIFYDLGYIGNNDNKNTNNTEQSFSTQTTQKPKEPASEPQDTNAGVDSPQNSNSSNSAESSDTKPNALQHEQTSAQNDMASETGKGQTYGLMGDVVPDIDKAYMIVVHSRRGRDPARENKQELENKGYRTTINRTDVDGKMQFRVGIGQFETIKDAQQAITKLPEPYKSNNFITRIR